jgi:hypothetical protein
LLMTLFTPFLEPPPHRSAQNLFRPQDETTIETLEQEPGPQKQNRGIRSLNKMQEGIIKITTKFPDGSPIEPKIIFFPNSAMTMVFLRGKNVRSPGLIGALF